MIRHVMENGPDVESRIVWLDLSETEHRLYDNCRQGLCEGVEAGVYVLLLKKLT